ncbi:MAG: glycosyltransferase family 2 protein [Selenomonadaceae bacterium]|nr:glycosyltransferase family 2 protein [Selenomonadaceae bacterium]
MYTEKIPLVSVIIPMFNAARFMPQTLESLRAQTLKDFEVIIVDDCSTDNSVEVVENFMDAFAAEGIRLHLLELPTNSGTPGFPRNLGIQLARGEYIALLDSDDFFSQTALEELATLAEATEADVVHTDTFFMLNEDNEIKICERQKLPPLPAPTFETTDIARRVDNWINRGYNWESVTMFCRRDFLVANQIHFPKMANNEDMVFSFSILCSAEKFLRVPNVTYVYRQRSDSVSHKYFVAPSDYLHKWLRVLTDGLNEFAKVMASEKFFAEHPDYRHEVLNFFYKEIAQVFPPLYAKHPPFVLDEFIKREFHPEDAELGAQLLSEVNTQQLMIAELRQELAKFQKQ